MELNRIQNMLLGIMIGDAFGAGYEFMEGEREAVKNSFDPNNYKAHYLDGHKAGNYTDDMQMSIGISELLSSDKEFNKQNLANSFVECYKRDSLVGYSKKFKELLDSINSGSELIEKINPDSIKNGAAMRSVPLGIINYPEKIMEYAKINASITHNTSKGIASSTAVALMSHLYLYDKELIFDYFNTFINNIDKESASYFKEINNMESFDPKLLFGEENISKGVPCNGMRTVGAVLHVLSAAKTPFDVLKYSVLLGGDTDSVASIALGIKMINHNIDELPEFLINNLTNGKYGKDYIIDLGNELAKKYRII